MKRNLFFVLLVILSISFMGNLFAQTSVTIGNGTASQRQPMSPYWGHERSAALYTFAEIGGVGTIESIGWNVANSKTTDVPYKIYLGTTADTQLTSQTFDSLTQNMILVDEGNYAFDSLGWHTITLSNPFTYTGGNLVVAVETNYGGSGAGYGNYAEFYYTTATNAHMYWNADSNPPAGNGNVNSYRPNLMLSLGELTGDPELSVNPDTDYEFPLTMINTTAQKEFSVANIGGGNINITGFSVSGDGFALADAFTPVTLGSGNMHNFTVEYTPTVAGNHTATLLIETSAGNHSAQLSGSCFDPTIRELPYTENFDSVATTSLPLGWTVLNPDNPNVTWQTSTTNPNSSPNCVRIGYTYSGDGPLNDWFITPPVEMEAGVEYRISYHYRAGSASYYEKLALRVGNAPTAAAMTETLIDHDGFNHATYDLVRTMFTPTADGNYFFGWHAYSAENLLAIYVDDITIELAPTTPLITLQNDDINFGSMRENTISDYQNLIIRNVGSGMLTVDMSNVSLVGSDTDQFEIDYSVLPLNIAAEESANLPIRFVPNNAGFKSATIQIVNSATSDVHEATLSGLAVGENDLFESFEATTFPPAGWANPGSWSRSTTYKVDGDASAYKYGSASTQYILRTPMLDVGAGDVFNFWSLVSSVTGKLQLVYSEDENTWTQIGADLEHAATSTWHNQTVDISSLAGSSYYFGIRTGLQSSSFYVDLVAGPQPTPMSPGTPTLSAPANASTNQNEMPELRWTVPTSGGVAFGYNIYLDTDPNPTTLFAQSTTNSLLVASPLDWNTTYYWKVAAYNNTGEGVASDVYSFTVKEDSTIRTFPFVEGFEDGYTQGQAVAGHWTQITGPVHSGKQWIANNTTTDYNRSPRTGTWNAYLAWGGQSTLIRPIILEGGKDYKLELYARQHGTANATINAAYGSSGNLADLTETIIAETGIVNGDYQQLEGFFTPTVDGIYYIGIMGTISSSEWYMSIDDIKIIEISDDPVLSYSPESIDFGDAVFGATVGPRNITIVNDGGGTLNLEVTDIEITGTNADLFSFDDSVFPVSLGTGITASIPVFVTGTAEGSASATLIINYDGVGHEIALSANILPDGLVLIGDGTADNKMPVNPWYGYSYAQMLYKADEILTQDRQIEKVAYHWNGDNIGSNSDQWTIYIGHTDKEAFNSTTDWIDINELTQVFHGDVAFLAEDTWIEIVLQMPFVYNGTDNLVIAVHETRPGNDGNNAFFYNTPSTAGRSIRCQNDNTNPDPAAPPTGTLTPAYPNIRMYFADVPEDAILSITPDSWDAGEIIINTQASTQFTVRNIGGGTLVVNEVTVSGDYFSLAAPLTGASLETGEGAPFTVNFNPLAAGDYQGSITIDTSVGVENIEIEGSCFDPTIRELPYTENFDSMTTPTMPMGWTVLNPDNPSVTWQTYSTNSYSSPNCVRIGYTPSAGGPLNDWFITPPVEMEAGKEYRVSFYYRASSFYGDENLALYFGSEPTETGMTELLWSDEGFNRDSYALVEEVVSPTADGSYFFGWYGYSEPYEYGICVDDVTIIELSPTPVFVVEPSSHDFGELKINTTSSKNIKVTNMGGGELVITEIEISGDDAFALGTLPTLPAILERDEFINFDAIFAPTAAGDHNATITITDNQNTRYTINAGSLRSGNSRSRDDHTVTLTGSCFDPTIYDFPYLEDFGTTTADWPPTEWTQRNGLYPNASGTTSQWVRGNWLNGASGNNAAKINIYGTVRNGWLITRPINIQSENFELKFDLGLTKWNNPDPINDLEGQPDDRFMVIVSDSPDMANPSILREWNNDDSELVFNHIPHTGIPVSIPLTGITGTKYFAFYAESTISNGDNDLFVDNVLIREIPDNPIFVINPESHDFDDIMVNTSASQVFTIINNGGGALIIDSIEIDGDDAFSLENLPELPTTLGAGDTATFGAVFAPSAGGDYSAIITVIDNLNTRYSVNAGPKRSRNTGSRAANTVTLTGSCFDPTIRTFPFFEGFEDGNTHNSTTISQWEQIIGSGTKQWTANNTFTDRNRTPRTGSWNAFLSWGGESTLIRPIMLEANQEYKLTFYARQDNANSTLANVKAAFGAGNTLDDLTETIIEQTGVVDGDYQEFSGVFSTETGGIYFIGITGWIDSSPWYLILDDITIDYNYIVTPNDHADVGGDTTASVTGDGFVGAIEVPMAPENLTPIPNPSFVVINHQVWQLIGTGEINLRFDNNGTEDIWFSHVVGGAWFAQEIPAGGHINVSVDLDAKDASLEFALGTGGNPTLPVELSYFNAVFMLNENSVKLSWKTESETQMLGYQIYRSMNTELANAILITPVIVTASNSSTGDSYSYLDKEVESGTYYYWLEAVSYNSSDYYGYQTVVIDIPSAPELPEISSMGNAYPNPFKNATSIDIAIKGGETGSFTIYNMLGQAVYREKLSEGNATIQWHGRDSNGNRCGSGVYFYKLVTPTKAETKKMVIMK